MPSNGILQRIIKTPNHSLGPNRLTRFSQRRDHVKIIQLRHTRNRLILELMARGGMRISEVLQLTPSDIEDRKLTLRSPKSGKEREIVFIPQKVVDRLREYINAKRIGADQRIFPISYTARQKGCEQGREGGWNSFKASRSQEACSYLRFSLRGPDRDCQQGDFKTCESFDDTEVSWDSK
jgi:integrase